MSEQFTKGPWLWGGASVVLESEGMPLCCLVNSAVNAGDNTEDYANAALIAAAPEMYEMLKAAADELLFMIRKANSDLIQSVTSTTETEPDYYDEQTVFEIMNLLKKARGEQ